MSHSIGYPPRSVIGTLRLEGFAALAAAVTAYWFLGGNWWVFALLLLAPDLSFLAYSAGEKTGAKAYNLTHTYTVPALLGAVGWLAGIGWLVPVALIWMEHIGMDRALGYGLKYPGAFKDTHLGSMGKSRKVEKVANAG